ncbi:MAG TPA: fused MFS/spermidine synthase, partial [Gemmatimonadaceae bacterium]|nr:fused MFS/spermidine synthase [Gemmatimonadaceae bacterium]
PMTVPASWVPPADATPVPWLLALLFVGVGLPFFAVSTTSPLVQAWFARSGHASASNPYALYAASNAGSMLALLGYPFIIEPQVALRDQSRLWSVGYIGFVLLLVGCMLLLVRTLRGTTGTVMTSAAKVAAGAARTGLPWRRRLRWVGLAFVPSSLMLSVTMYMSTNIAPFPLLWVLPLALYLLTFIVAFASRRLVPLPVLRRVMPFVVLPLLVIILADATQPIRFLIGAHLVAFTMLALLCHTELAHDAPGGESLTDFYLCLSVGGALGGVFNALVAPLLFDTVLEYPLVLAVAAFLVPIAQLQETPGAVLAPARTPRALALDAALPIALASLTLLLHVVARRYGFANVAAGRVVTLGIPALLCFTLAEHRLRFALGIAALIVAAGVFVQDTHLLLAERSFFGISRVSTRRNGSHHELAHGNIAHGVQRMDGVGKPEPLTYYTRSGPVGQLIMERQRVSAVRRVAVVGLGAGSLACYRRDGEVWQFFEIDPVVLRIARDPQYFTYLRDCAPEAQVVLGDARLSLTREPARAYDLILLDAYSADAIPVHLMTREALALYRARLAPGGVIALHVSNRYFDLPPVVDALAYDARMVSLVQYDNDVSEAEALNGKAGSVWMLLADSVGHFGRLTRDPRWQMQPGRSRSPVWTDDFSSTLSALRR